MQLCLEFKIFGQLAKHFQAFILQEIDKGSSTNLGTPHLHRPPFLSTPLPSKAFAGSSELNFTKLLSNSMAFPELYRPGNFHRSYSPWFGGTHRLVTMAC
ncbi:hypothetical protein TWF225_008121 [Orbilia oligospora]|nr:hypothetical protein TWF225_008121 [Orbilia oligospora]KAF3261337.1 hypothetical protein TWF128_003112 [Orbilia oligospora]KAF3268828.1 hypothetical protein TWF217_010124 [Orbilia oligospora]